MGRDFAGHEMTLTLVMFGMMVHVNIGFLLGKVNIGTYF